MSGDQDGKEYICKDCGASYKITPELEHYYTRKRPGLKTMTVPVRCDDCRAIHTAQVKNLARATVNIPNAETGEGCYIGLTRDHLYKTSGWQLSFNWEKVAPVDYPTKPTAIMFNVDQKLASLIYFEDVNNGLVVKGFDYAPWVDEYERGKEAIVQYMVSESMRRGYGGAFTITPKPADRRFFERLGMKPVSFVSQALVMPAIGSQEYILSDAGIPDAIRKKLNQKNSVGKADLSWISLKVSQGKLTPLLAEEITKARSHINWNTFKRYMEKSRRVKGKRRDALVNNLKGIFGQLKALDILNSLDPDLVAKTEMQMMGQSVDIIVQFKRNVSLSNCLRGNPKTGNVETYSFALKAGQGAAVECKTWGLKTFLIPSNIDTLIDEIRMANRVLNTVLVMVTSDFDRLHEDRKAHIVARIASSGAVVCVMKGFSLDSAKSYIRGLVRDLV